MSCTVEVNTLSKLAEYEISSYTTNIEKMDYENLKSDWNSEGLYPATSHI